MQNASAPAPSPASVPPVSASPIAPTINQEAIDAAVADVDGGWKAPAPFDSLTKREQQTAMSLAMGQKNDEIAEAYGISIKTVDTHRAHVLKKLGLRNNVDIARLAISTGWVKADGPRTLPTEKEGE